MSQLRSALISPSPLRWCFVFRPWRSKLTQEGYTLGKYLLTPSASWECRGWVYGQASRGGSRVYGAAIQRLHTRRLHSSLEEMVPREARERFKQLVHIDESGRYSIAQSLEDAIADADRAHTTWLEYSWMEIRF